MDEKYEELLNDCKSCSEMRINLNTNNDKIYNCQECKRVYLIQTISINETSIPTTTTTSILDHHMSVESNNTSYLNLEEDDDYLFKSWDIKKSDVISLQTIYSSCQVNSSSLIPSISIIEQHRYFKFNSKCFHLGGYTSTSNSTLKFSHNTDIDLKAKGLFHL